MKRLLSVFLVLVLVFSIAFQCSFQSSAVAGIDDALLIGAICFDLLGLGITFYSVEQFCQTPAFEQLCNEIGTGIEQKIRTIEMNGVLFYLTAKSAWDDLCSWVKRTFSGADETKDIELDVTESTSPSSLTLKDGTTCPYGQWMSHPFFIYRSGTTLYGFNCTGADVGAYFLKTVIQIQCVGTGQVNQYRLAQGASEWTLFDTYHMTYGTTYMGQTGSVYNITYANNADMTRESIYLYRTMNRIVNMEGEVDSSVPPASTVPDTETTTKYTVTAESDATYYPGKVLAPATDIADTDNILIKVPDELVVEDALGNKSLSTNIPLTANTIADTYPADVRPVVQTNTITHTTTIEQIIADTPAESIPGSSSSDIETANKFKLPKSFLEGFPFSIPYSIFVGIQSFVAEPQAPVFNFPFSIPALNLNEDVEIDLSEWSPVARLCRAILSLVWVAGLAFACHRFIKR